jgi:hypothetical protein
MSKRFIITEQEKKDIKKLYNLNEGILDDTLDYLKTTEVGKAVKDFVQDTFGTTNPSEIANKIKDKAEELTSGEEKDLEKSLTDAKLKDLTYGNEDKYSGDSFIGQAFSISLKDAKRINGFPNNFWGGGGEDDSMYRRLKKHNINIMIYHMLYNFFLILSH